MNATSWDAPATLCLAHRRPLNVCGCRSPDDSAEAAMYSPQTRARWDSNLRRQQARVNAEQWLDVAEVREFHEHRGDVPRGTADPHLGNQLLEPVPTWMVYVGVAIVALGAGLTMFWISGGLRP